MSKAKAKPKTNDTPINRLRYRVRFMCLFVFRLCIAGISWLNEYLFVGLLDATISTIIKRYNIALSRHQIGQIKNGMYTGLTVTSFLDDPLCSIITIKLDPILRKDPRLETYVRGVVAYGSYIHPDQIHYAQLDSSTVKIVVNRA